MEEWKSICKDYEVSNLGNVRSYRSPTGKGPKRTTPKILKPVASSKGYSKVNLNGKILQVSRLVCEAFYGKSPLQVNHKNGIKSDNRLENLEYCTHSENIQHAYDTGLLSKGFGSKSGLNEADISNLIKDKRPQRIIAKDYGISQFHVSRIKRHYMSENNNRG